MKEALLSHDATKPRTEAAEPTNSPLGRFRRRPSRRSREGLGAYAFLSPWLLGMVLLTMGPMLGSLYLSFTRYDLFTAPSWVGLDNYRRLVTDERFAHSVQATLTYVGVSVPLVLAFSLFLAVLVDRGTRFLHVYRVLFYLPSLLATSVAVAILWRRMFGQAGLFNQVLGAFGIQHGSWVGNPSTALYTIVTLNVWAFGATMIIFLAGLRQIPKDLYDSAAIDGAGPIRRFRYITLPQLTPIIFFNGLMATVHAFQAFTGAYIVSNGTGGPADSTLLYIVYLYQVGFEQFSMGYASAMAWVLLLFLAGVTAMAFVTARYWVHYGDER